MKFIIRKNIFCLEKEGSIFLIIKQSFIADKGEIFKHYSDDIYTSLTNFNRQDNKDFRRILDASKDTLYELQRLGYIYIISEKE